MDFITNGNEVRFNAGSNSLVYSADGSLNISENRFVILPDGSFSNVLFSVSADTGNVNIGNGAVTVDGQTGALRTSRNQAGIDAEGIVSGTAYRVGGDNGNSADLAVTTPDGVKTLHFQQGIYTGIS